MWEDAMPEPLYKQIALELQQKIQSGELAPGEQLPNETEFREQFGASRNTIRDAVKWLTSRGLVETKPGKGTFVSARIEPIVTTLSDDPDTGKAGGEGAAAFNEVNKRQAQKGEPPTAHASKPTVEVLAAPDYVADRLRIESDEVVLVRHQEFYIAEAPYMLQTTYYPMNLVEQGATTLFRPDDIEEGAVKYLADTLGIVQCGTRLRVLIRPPDEHEARFFGLPDDGRVSVVSLIRTGYADKPDEGGPYPYRVTFTVMPGDRNQFVINSGKVPEELAAPARDS
jgi:GntR family transcriptional regulator